LHCACATSPTRPDEGTRGDPGPVDRALFAADYRMSVKRNILFNYIGSGFAALLPILALPWYIAALGPKLWGLVAFVTLMQAVLGLLDAGTSQALTREVALRMTGDASGMRRAAALLAGFERIYWAFAILAALITAALADVLAANWLNLADLPEASGRLAIYGAAAIFAAQFPGSVYRSVLSGGQAQGALNAVVVAGVIARHGGGVLIVTLWPTLPAYLGWQVAMALAETGVRAVLAWHCVGGNRRETGWNAREMRQVFPLVAQLTGAVFMGALTAQMDKIVLSRMLHIEQFGYYAIASALAMGVLQFIHPVFNAALPRVVQLHAEPAALRRFNFKIATFVTLLIVSAALVFLLAGRQLLDLWLRNAGVAAAVYPPLSILLAGTALNALYNIGYINWLSKGKTGKILLVNAVSLVFSIALLPTFVAWQGLPGAALGWVTINAVGLLLSLEWLKAERAAGGGSQTYAKAD